MRYHRPSFCTWLITSSRYACPGNTPLRPRDSTSHQDSAPPRYETLMVRVRVRGHLASPLHRPAFGRAVVVPCGRRLILRHSHSEVVDGNVCSIFGIVTLNSLTSRSPRGWDAYRPFAALRVGLRGANTRYRPQGLCWLGDDAWRAAGGGSGGGRSTRRTTGSEVLARGIRPVASPVVGS